MKYYGIHKGKLGSKLRFKIYKISQGIELLLIRDKKKLENKKGLYNEQFGKISQASQCIACLYANCPLSAWQKVRKSLDEAWARKPAHLISKY